MQENERQRIARDLHDGVGQLLAAAHINLSRVEPDPKSETSQNSTTTEVRVALERTRTAIERAIDDVRSISHALGSSTLRELGLVSALEELISSIGSHRQTQFQFFVSGMEARLPDTVETGLFRIAQELITNIERHAHASEATLQIVRTPEELRLTVEDNGTGFDTATARGGMGRGNIDSRVRALDGQIRWDSTPGHGTTVTVVVGVRGEETLSPGARESPHGFP